VKHLNGESCVGVERWEGGVTPGRRWLGLFAFVRRTALTPIGSWSFDWGIREASCFDIEGASPGQGTLRWSVTFLCVVEMQSAAGLDPVRSGSGVISVAPALTRLMRCGLSRGNCQGKRELSEIRRAEGWRGRREGQ
jgi:hypothetical protein